MNIETMFRDNPILKRLKDRDDFDATVAVTLRLWDQLDEASWWCSQQWQDLKRQSRRRLDVEHRTAQFEFKCAEVATEFLLKFGSSATGLF